MFDSKYLVSNMGSCSNRKAQTQDHAGRLGNEADQVEGGGRLVRQTVETEICSSVAVQNDVWAAFDV